MTTRALFTRSPSMLSARSAGTAGVSRASRASRWTRAAPISRGSGGPEAGPYQRLRRQDGPERAVVFTDATVVYDPAQVAA